MCHHIPNGIEIQLKAISEGTFQHTFVHTCALLEEVCLAIEDPDLPATFFVPHHCEEALSRSLQEFICNIYSILVGEAIIVALQNPLTLHEDVETLVKVEGTLGPRGTNRIPELVACLEPPCPQLRGSPLKAPPIEHLLWIRTRQRGIESSAAIRRACSVNSCRPGVSDLIRLRGLLRKLEGRIVRGCVLIYVEVFHRKLSINDSETEYVLPFPQRFVRREKIQMWVRSPENDRNDHGLWLHIAQPHQLFREEIPHNRPL